MSKFKQYPPLLTPKQHEEFLKIIQKDYDENPNTKEPPFEEPKQFDIGFIPTVGELALAFSQATPANTWPCDTYKHELMIVTGYDQDGDAIEKSLGMLTFTKLDGQWVYFGPTKYK